MVCPNHGCRSKGILCRFAEHDLDRLRAKKLFRVGDAATVKLDRLAGAAARYLRSVYMCDISSPGGFGAKAQPNWLKRGGTIGHPSTLAERGIEGILGTHIAAIGAPDKWPEG